MPIAAVMVKAIAPAIDIAIAKCIVNTIATIIVIGIARASIIVGLDG